MLDYDMVIAEYTKYATDYPNYVVKKTSYNKAKAMQLVKLNQILLENPLLMHRVIDALITSKDIGISGVVSLLAISANYRKNEAKKVLLGIIKGNKIPLYSYYLNFHLNNANEGDK